jgi:hypothetical protein
MLRYTEIQAEGVGKIKLHSAPMASDRLPLPYIDV